jgi:hypothetical protein
MRAITRGVDLNATRRLPGFLVLTTGVAIAVDRAWEGPEGRFGFRLIVEGEVVEGQFDRSVVVPHVDTAPRAGFVTHGLLTLKGIDRGPGGEPARCQSTLYATGIGFRPMMAKPAWRVVCASCRAISALPLSRCLAAP